MKYFGTLSIIASLSMLSLNVTQIHAAEYSDSQETVFSKTVFPDLSDDDLVIELPDGGYLYGKCEVYDISDQTSPIIIYDSTMDSNAIPVKKARNRIKYRQTAFPTQTYGATPPGTDTIYVLDYGSEYNSNPFSGNGWRFSGKQFKAKSGTGGDYLRWTSYIDSGRVGNYNEAYATKNSGTIQGTALEIGVPIWNSEGNLGQIYYTYNPLAGTYYNVANING